MNSVNLIGRLVADPAFQVVNDKELTKFVLAVDGRGEQAHFIECACWGKTAELVANHFVKGKQIGVTGELRQERWENKDGAKRSKLTVNVNNVTFVGKKGEE